MPVFLVPAATWRTQGKVGLSCEVRAGGSWGTAWSSLEPEQEALLPTSTQRRASLPQALVGRKGPGPVFSSLQEKKRPLSRPEAHALSKERLTPKHKKIRLPPRKRVLTTAFHQPASPMFTFSSLPSLVIEGKALSPMKGFRAKRGPESLSAGVREHSPAGPTMYLMASPHPSVESPALATPQPCPPACMVQGCDAPATLSFPAPRGLPRGRPTASLGAGCM